MADRSQESIALPAELGGSGDPYEIARRSGGDVPLDVENREAGVAWVDGYAAFDVSSRAQCLA
jgi:hypothetical protein